MSDAPAPEWGLVYNEPGKPDMLLEARFTAEDVAVRIAVQIARQMIAQMRDEQEIHWHRSSQNVVSVASKISGKTFCTIRPVRARVFLAGGHEPAPPLVNSMIQRLLDDDDWLR